MGGVDVIVFTGGIGENDVPGRAAIMEGFEYMGVEFSNEANHGKRGKEVILSTPTSKVTVMVVPTNEELVIAQDTLEIVNALKN